MDAVSYSHADKQKQRIEKFIEQPDSTSGVVTVPDTIASGESIEIATGRQIVVDHLDVQGTLDIQGTLATVSGGYLSQTTMKTQAIAHTNGTNAMTIDSSGNVMLGSNYLTPYTGFKNRIINGAMMIDQRNAGAAQNPIVSGNFIVDRIKYEGSQAGKFSAQQNAGAVTPPAGFLNYVGITSLSAYSVSASDIFKVCQGIEGYNIADLGWGTVNAQAVTLSFWVRSSLTGVFGGSLLGGQQTFVSYPFTYTISTANTWTQIVITVPGPTIGSWNATNLTGIELIFGLGVGTVYSGTAGLWQSANYQSAIGATSVVGTNGATFYITGVQLEKGSVATPFENRPYGLELSLCQRYYQKITDNVSFTADNNVFGLYQTGNSYTLGRKYLLPVSMRTSPTVYYASLTTGYTGGTPTVSANSTSLFIGLNSSITGCSNPYIYVSGITLSAEL